MKDKWVEGEMSFINDKRRLFMRTGYITTNEDIKRLCLQVLLPETISPSNINDLVEKIKDLCEEELNINDFVRN